MTGGGSVQAGGAPQKSGKESRGREEGIQMGDSDAPQTSLSCMSSGTPSRADFTLSQGMKRSPRDTRDFLPTGERDSSRVPSLRSPYIDAAQVEPLLKAEEHRAVTHHPVGTAEPGVSCWDSFLD